MLLIETSEYNRRQTIPTNRNAASATAVPKTGLRCCRLKAAGHVGVAVLQPALAAASRDIVFYRPHRPAPLT